MNATGRNSLPFSERTRSSRQPEVLGSESTRRASSPAGGAVGLPGLPITGSAHALEEAIDGGELPDRAFGSSGPADIEAIDPDELAGALTSMCRSGPGSRGGSQDAAYPPIQTELARGFRAMQAAGRLRVITAQTSKRVWPDAATAASIGAASAGRRAHAAGPPAHADQEPGWRPI